MAFHSAYLSRDALPLLFISAFGLLLTVLASSWILGSGRATAGRRAFAHWLPIGTCTVLFALRGHADMAMGLLFGTSIAMLSSVFGLIGLAGAERGARSGHKPVWIFVPAVTLLAFLVGLRGAVGWFEAGVMVCQGFVLLYLWGDGSEIRRPDSIGVQIITVIGVGCVAALSAIVGMGAMWGAEQTSAGPQSYPTGVLAATLLSIAMAIPLLITSAPMLVRGEVSGPLNAALGVVLLNLCALLPLTIFAWALHQSAIAFPNDSILAIHHGAWKAFAGSTMPFPMLAWRIDALCLVILSVVLIPLALEHLPFDRRLSGLLLLGYGFYLLSVIIVGNRYRDTAPQSAPTPTTFPTEM